jgi:hypothetical protein
MEAAGQSETLITCISTQYRNLKGRRLDSENPETSYFTFSSTRGCICA